MDSQENYIELQDTHLMSDEYAKKNFELIKSIMELEKELMQPSEGTGLGSQRTELNCINQNVMASQNIYYSDYTNILQAAESENNRSLSSKLVSSSVTKLNRSYESSMSSNKLNMANVDNSTYPYDLEGVAIPGETTEQIARKIKEFLIENKISQRMLAENLLNMKQANLSPLLCNPKPWEAMTPIIRNRFIVMHLWLNDENRIEKLNVLPSRISHQLNSSTC